MNDVRAKPSMPMNQVDDVLQDYLDQLLITATEAAKISEQKADQVTEKKVEPITPTVAPKVKVAEARGIETAKAVEPEVIITTAAPTTKLAIPDWRNSQGVECLIFKVAGLKLAIPLSLLGGVHPVTDKITPLIGQVPWSLGVWAGEEFKLTIIDSAQLMMPERNISLKNTDYSFFIQLDRSPWALACQEICDTVTLVYDSIKWRGDASKRPWLAGTVIDEMCALVDVPQIMTLLEERRWPSN